MKVKKRKRLANGQMGNLLQAVNMVTGEKRPLLVDSRLIVEQDINALEVLLRDHVQLAPHDCQIFIQVSELALKKKAKLA